ncbi:hypothetical protein ACH41E_27945 [Streptomyces sp. NPDC020412]|uniref:hypothetical protein n=1 Tax=Streptomyces sp. NPDC020412 TaxID=3365073 RepID=UPI0037B14D02
MTAVALSLTALTACGAGNNAQTLGVRPDNAAATVDSISVQNATVITQPKAGESGPAAVSATIFNKGQEDQTLDSITLSDGAGTVKLTAANGSGPVTVPALGSVIIGGKGNASAVIDNGDALTKKIGGVQNVVFKLSKTGDVTLESFVVPANAEYAKFGPSGQPPAPAAPKPSGEPGGEGEAADPAKKDEPGQQDGTPAGNENGQGDNEGGTGSEQGSETPAG